MFFTLPGFYPYLPGYYPHYPRTVNANQYLAEQRGRAWALPYLQQSVNEPTLTSLLTKEYDEFPNQNHPARQDFGFNSAGIPECHCCALRAHSEAEEGFARRHADAEKFLEEAETYLSEYLPPDQEPYVDTFRPFDLPDTPVPVQGELLVENVIDDCVMAENHRMAEYRLEVHDTLESILSCLHAATSTEISIKLVPVPSAAVETSSTMELNVNEEGTISSQEGEEKAKEVPWI